MVVGAEEAANQGYVYVFDYDGTSWNRGSIIRTSDGDSKYDGFGYDVDINADWVGNDHL